MHSYISPIIGIDGLHLEVDEQWTLELEESYQIDSPSYGFSTIYKLNRLSLKYLGIVTKKKYGYYDASIIPGIEMLIDINKQSISSSYRFIKKLSVNIGGYFMRMDNIKINRGNDYYTESNLVIKEYGVDLGLSYDYRNFLIKSSYNQGLKIKNSAGVKPSKSYSLYLGYQFKIFDTKWFNKKGQKCPKF